MDSLDVSRKRFAHVGVAVADLDRAIEFYKVLLQTEPIGTYSNDRTPFIDELVGYEAKMREAWFELDNGAIELIEYSEPRPGTTDPETYNAGHMHLCVQVDDIEAEYERLLEADVGIEFRSLGPVTVPDDDPGFAGERYLYMRTPDGSTIEFFQAAGVGS